ncbi:hypothetical protein O1W69_05100 [Chlamydia sp. 12-01]|uniref:hypothetical protein n=1 Tax=Chlamydia sp. 12-01 TaxID=3002742 RepID=UPI0035D4F295
MNCFIYKNNSEFFCNNQNTNWLFKEGFIRSETHMQPYTIDWIIDVTNTDEIKELFIRCIPIIGNILGCGKLYSLWSTRDPKDRYKDVLFHTLSGVLETLGLGIIALSLKIITTVTFYIFEFLKHLMYTIISILLPNLPSSDRFFLI